MFLLYTISFFVMSLFYVCVLSLVCFFFPSFFSVNCLCLCSVRW